MSLLLHIILQYASSVDIFILLFQLRKLKPKGLSDLPEIIFQQVIHQGTQPGFNFKISFFFSFCFFFLCVCVCACSVAKLCLTSCDPMDCSPPGSSMHGLFLARILEWVAISSFRRSFQPRDGMHISCVSYIASKYNLVLPLYLSS